MLDNFINDGFMWAKNETIIHLDEDNAIMSDEEALVNFALTKA
jgi:hypothetical protein